MGLDMYLHGEVFLCGLTKQQMLTQPINLTYRLGYWWQHANLHEYILNEFGDGTANSVRITLDENEMRQIIDAVTNKAIKWSSFGKNAINKREGVRTTTILYNAIEWLNNSGENSMREVYYQASW